MFNNKDMFPKVCENIRKTDMITNKYIYCYPILLKCFKNIIQNKSILDPIIGIKVHNIGLYAINEFMDYVLEDENIKKFFEVRLYDRDAHRYSFEHAGKKVGDIQKLLNDYKAIQIDKIIICNLTHGNEIARDFINLGIDNKDIVVLDALIYGI